MKTEGKQRRPETLNELANRRLAALTFEGEAQVMQAVLSQPGRRAGTRSRLRLALMIGLLTLLVLGTALAIGLIYSNTYSARKAADSALMTRYHLHPDSLGMFYVRETKDEASTTFTYTPNMNDKQTGTYTVVLRSDGQAQTSWTHDEIAPEIYEGGNLDAPVWGAAQLNKYVKLKNAYYGKMAELDWRLSYTWTLEQRAEIYGLLDAMQEAYGEQPYRTYLVPDETDIKEEAVPGLAIAALAQTYGLSEAYFADFVPNYTFSRLQEDQQKHYWVDLRRAETWSNLNHEGEVFQIQILSPSGEARKPVWHIKDLALRSLPAGDLRPYAHAVREYMDVGAFDILSAQDKGRLAQRLVSAGFAEILQDTHYIIPGPGLVGEEQANELAQAAMLERYALTQEMLDLFERSSALVMEDKQAIWLVRYAARSFLQIDVVLFPPLGEYTLRLDARDGQVLAAEWTLADVDNKQYTQHTWGQTQAYNAHILPWLLALYQQANAIQEKYTQEDWLMSLEDQAAYDALFRDNGFPPASYPHSLPRPDELQLEPALAIAQMALREELHLSEQLIGQLEPVMPFFLRYANYLKVASGDPVWLFRYDHPEGIYQVYINGKTGELLLVEYQPMAAGNG